MNTITKLSLLLAKVSDLSNALMSIENEITDLIDEIIDETDLEEIDEDEDEEIDENIKIGLDSQD